MDANGFRHAGLLPACEIGVDADRALSGQGTPQEVMDNLAETQDAMLARIAEAKVVQRCEPRLNEAIDPQTRLDRPGAQKPKLDDEQGQGVTVDYERLLESWRKKKSQRVGLCRFAVNLPPTWLSWLINEICDESKRARS